jgi:hypothetical protein
MQVRDERFWIGAAWGVAAVVIMSVVEAVFLAFGSEPMREAMPLVLAARLIARLAGLRELTTGVFAGAVVMQFIYGAVWAGLLAASTARVTWWKGMLVGLGLLMISLIFVWPAGGTLFQFATSGSAWVAAIIIHLVYGISIGLLAGRHEPELIEEPV